MGNYDEPRCFIPFYLNSEFGGGELEFCDLGLTIKPKKGMMIAFPSYKEFAHKVHPVTWGHRYTLVSWVQTQKHLYDTIPRPGFQLIKGYILPYFSQFLRNYFIRVQMIG